LGARGNAYADKADDIGCAVGKGMKSVSGYAGAAGKKAIDDFYQRDSPVEQQNNDEYPGYLSIAVIIHIFYYSHLGIDPLTHIKT
jgi:hypothetical protein